ncbi:MAG: aspartate-semialdehyde dehydrogenase [Anaerolineae bacterium]|nr:aspartate-semialdehyde dehydrogenase [Thermoflexales bacterium]MDW8406838.1 aspartate-semialdehyde dehydrogenase [Anaerolineae bacterium]
MSAKIPVAVLGATGAVGQRFVQLLQNHPFFEIVALTASDRSEGKRYIDAVRWVIEGDAPAAVQDMILLPTDAQTVMRYATIAAAFSALPNEAAQVAEPAFAQAGVLVFSNASFYRMHSDVPLVIPEVNADHLRLLTHQRRARGWSGGIICNTNCTVSGPAMTLRPLYDTFGVKRVFAVSLQAQSGAGYPGVPSLDITDNVLPFIKGEEEKLEAEARKLLGALREENGEPRGVVEAPLSVSAHCNRVPVIDGHLVTLSIELETPARVEEVMHVLQTYRRAEVAGLPTAPHQPIVVRNESDRPQPRRDRMAGHGMSTVVGRVRPEPLFGACGVKCVTLAHNTIRGAAGGSILNAEVWFKVFNA